MRRGRVVVLVALCLALALVYIPGVVNAKTITMKLGHYAAPGHPADRAANMFAENVQKRTNGEIVIAVYPNNQLGDPPQLLEQNILGVIDVSLPTQGALDKYSRKFAVVMLPFVYRDYEHAHKVLDGPFKEWTAGELEKQGLIFLSNWEWGFRNLTNNVRPINSPDDVKGLKIRTPQRYSFRLLWRHWVLWLQKYPLPSFTWR